MKKLTLRWRITILTALVLAACSMALTVASIVNADRVFVSPIHAEMITSTANGHPPEYPSKEVATAERAKRQFDVSSVLFCVFVTAFGTTAVYIAVGKALRPLRELIDAVETIDERTLSKRLPEAESNDEIWKLTRDFNGMLNRLDDAFLRQKRFTANAAHELKTPLAMLKTGAQVLNTDKSAVLSDYQDYAEKTSASVDRLSQIVDDLLLMASAGETAGNAAEEVLLEPLFEAIQDELSLLLDERKITCIVDCRVAEVKGNPLFLYRAFFNLMENACKYGQEGGHIWMTALENVDTVHISVRDDGPGIPKEHLPYIFDAFYRVDKSRSREMGGSGLGLSLVKTMVNAMDGDLMVESDGNNGTCFVVNLRK